MTTLQACNNYNGIHCCASSSHHMLRVRSLEQTLSETIATVQGTKQQLLKEKVGGFGGGRSSSVSQYSYLLPPQEDAQNKDERIQRLERRLLFVTKERDGCVNVLKSYQLDKSVDGLLREQLKEVGCTICYDQGVYTLSLQMEQQLSRAKERIEELEVWATHTHHTHTYSIFLSN